LADEILYQARIHPAQGDLEEDEIVRLWEATDYVVKTCVDLMKRGKKYPADWLFHRRWGKNGHAEDAEGNRLSFAKIAGRTTAFVPPLQKLRKCSAVKKTKTKTIAAKTGTVVRNPMKTKESLKSRKSATKESMKSRKSATKESMKSRKSAQKRSKP